MLGAEYWSQNQYSLRVNGELIVPRGLYAYCHPNQGCDLVFFGRASGHIVTYYLTSGHDLSYYGIVESLSQNDENVLLQRPTAPNVSTVTIVHIF